MSKYTPILEVANLNNVSVLANAPIPLNTAVHGNSSVLTSNGTGVTINKLSGYYQVIGQVTFTVPVAGDVTISIMQGNTAVASTTVTAAINTTYSVTIPKILLAKCCTLPNTLTLTTSLAITSLNATLDVNYLSERN